ncbi:MAG: peptidoglycan editing factor PgeF [Candidatus Omnitrophota bacterium]
MSFCYGDTKESLNNRKSFLGNLGIDYRDLVCAKQVHSNRLKYVTEEDKGRGALSYDGSVPDTDAFITDKKRIPLAVFTADCLSVFLFEPNKSVIGLVHAGWRSTKENITTRAVESMSKELDIHPEDLYAGFGPAIRRCCYEVGEEFKDHFTYGLEERLGRYYLDLARINKKELLELGVSEKNIFDPEICTSCRNEEFFSYRKEGKGTGRMISVMMLR